MSSFCGYSDVHIFVKGSITVPNTAAVDVDASNGKSNI